MNLWVLGFDFRSAPLEVRAKLLLDEKEALPLLVEGLEEKMFIATCNRVELYGSGSLKPQDLLQRWLRLCNATNDQEVFFRVYEGNDALRHLFKTTSSLESMVVGETQIMGQVKRAYDRSMERGWVGPVLHGAFQRGFKVAKRIRSQTEVGRFAVSIPSIGVKLAEKVMGDLRSRSVGIIGLGEIGRVAAEHFASVQPRNLYLYNRTTEIAEDLAAKLKTEMKDVRMLRDLGDILDKSDVIVSAVDTRLLEKAELERLAKRNVNIFILDLSVPPSVARTEISEQIYLFSVDDLEKIAKENTQLREHELAKAEKLIQEEVDSFGRSKISMKASDTLRNLDAKVQQITDAEVQELRARLPHLKPQDWAEIEKMAKRLGSRVVQDPIVGLKTELKATEETETVIEFFRSLFKI